ncbi:MAG: TetR/AcrR family transcriptional regulator [Acidobacteriota bacterium]
MTATGRGGAPAARQDRGRSTRGGGRRPALPVRRLRQGASYDRRHIRLLSEAAALFARRGFHRTSIRDLARATGRSLSGLYYYFDSKEELLYQIQHHCYSTLMSTAEEALLAASGAHERLIAFISHHLGYFRHNMNEMKVLAHEDLTLSGEPGEKIRDLKRRYAGMLANLLKEYAREGPARPDQPSPEMAAFILFGMMNWLYTWPHALRNLSAEELARGVAQIFMCGYPGCPASALASMRDSIICSGGRFWEKAGGDIESRDGTDG